MVREPLLAWEVRKGFPREAVLTQVGRKRKPEPDDGAVARMLLEVGIACAKALG